MLYYLQDGLFSGFVREELPVVSFDNPAADILIPGIRCLADNWEQLNMMYKKPDGWLHRDQSVNTSCKGELVVLKVQFWGDCPQSQF